jgi:hypothetical protein
VSSAEGTLTIGPATVGDVIDEGATMGVFAGDGLCESGIINTAINVRAKPAIGNAIQPAHPAADMMRGKIWRWRDLGRENDGGGSASPCHSHKPASLLSVLIKTASAEGNIGASSVTATASLYAGPIDPRCSACMAHKSPLSCGGNIPRAVRRHTPGRAPRHTGFEAAPSRCGEAHRRAKQSSF